MNWPTSQHEFGLQSLAEVAGIDVPTIQRWQHRGAIKFEPIGRGKFRSYSLTDALHLAVIKELNEIGVTITGTGAELSVALVEWAKSRLIECPEIAKIKPVALRRTEDGSDWYVYYSIGKAIERGSSIVIDLEHVVRKTVFAYKTTI